MSPRPPEVHDQVGVSATVFTGNGALIPGFPAGPRTAMEIYGYRHIFLKIKKLEFFIVYCRMQKYRKCILYIYTSKG